MGRGTKRPCGKREHQRLQKYLFELIGIEPLALDYHIIMDADPSHPRHREWDHHPLRLNEVTRPEHLLAWAVHLALDYELCADWVTIAHTPANRRRKE
jgi:hypothetical protein